MVTKIYNSDTRTIVNITNPADINPNTQRANWLQTVLDNQGYKNLYFISDELPNCDKRYYKIVLSTDVDGIGKHAKYRIGAVVEMSTVEKEKVDFVPVSNPLTPERKKLQDDKLFCQSIYDEFLLANRANPSITVDTVIEQVTNNVAIKMLIDAGAVTSLQTLITGTPDTTLTQEQKTYFLKKFDDYIAGN